MRQTTDRSRDKKEVHRRDIENKSQQIRRGHVSGDNKFKHRPQQ
jgi:hypothetical protein